MNPLLVVRVGGVAGRNPPPPPGRGVFGGVQRARGAGRETRTRLTVQRLQRVYSAPLSPYSAEQVAVPVAKQVAGHNPPAATRGVLNLLSQRRIRYIHTTNVRT